MKPSSPVILGQALPETIYAKEQPPYEPLPVYELGDAERTVVSRWKLSWRERLSVVLSGNVYLWQMTFGRPLQPVTLEASRPEVESIPDTERNLVGPAERQARGRLVPTGNYSRARLEAYLDGSIELTELLSHPKGEQERNT